MASDENIKRLSEVTKDLGNYLDFKQAVNLGITFRPSDISYTDFDSFRVFDSEMNKERKNGK